jgi:hypothetical protein
MFGRNNFKNMSANDYVINNNSNSMMRMNYYKPSPNMEVNNVLPPLPVPAPQPQPPSKGMRWGAPTWFLLHTLAEKVKDEHFDRIKIDLFRSIYTICTNLPCPDCSNHAKQYLDSINFALIRTKQDLKNMLFVFHNMVNQRKGQPIYTKEEMENTYPKAVTVNIINNFLFHFSDKSRSPKLMAGDLYRSRITVNIKEWLTQNMYCFNH